MNTGSDVPKGQGENSPGQSAGFVKPKSAASRKEGVRHGLITAVLTALLLFSFFLALYCGSSTEDFQQLSFFQKSGNILKTIFQRTRDSLAGSGDNMIYPTMDSIIWLRLSRAVLAVLVGMALAAAGTIMQSFFQNPMASPYILGISSGAVLGVTVAGMFAIDFWLLGFSSRSLFAFLGSLAVTLLVYTLSRQGGRIHNTTLLLTGIAMGTLAIGLSWMIMFLRTYNYDEIIFWLMGTFNGKRWSDVAVVFPFAAAGLVLVRIFARDLNVLLLGEETARHLGISVDKIKIMLLVLSTLLTASAVAAVGIVGFVGLVVPHLMRLIVGPDHRHLITASALTGGVLVLLADTFVRTVLNEMIPIGIITSVIGSPFFLYLLSRKERTFV